MTLPLAQHKSESSLSQQGVELTGTLDETDPQHSSHQTTEKEGDAASATSSYEDPSDNDLGMLQAAALLTADCLGTGLLALPQDVQVLGRFVGLGFLILNLPINLYAGTILSNAAGHVEMELEQDDTVSSPPDSISVDRLEQQMAKGDGIVRGRRVVRKSKPAYSSINAADDEDSIPEHGASLRSSPSNAAEDKQTKPGHDASFRSFPSCRTTGDRKSQQVPSTNPQIQQQSPPALHDQHHHQTDACTYDFIGMTQELFHHPRATHMVMAVFYTNIFLVLGDYILVMSHSVRALIGEDTICLPSAGILASTLMFAFSQLRTMANLGRTATFLSLTSLAIVVALCLAATQLQQQKSSSSSSSSLYHPPEETPSVLAKLSSLASIVFAVGSAKLLLNVRHEMKRRAEAPKTLGIALTTFVSVYIAICLLAGSNPPSFLFDAIPPGIHRRVAGLLLWIHVAVSYAINSQAICASMDRIFVHRIELFDLRHRPERRWLLLTLFMAVSSYLVANAVPFFKDLVALIGSLTSVPLSFILPAIVHRRAWSMPLWYPTRRSLWSYGLFLFGVAFLIGGLAGSLGSIELDWTRHGAPFSCS